MKKKESETKSSKAETEKPETDSAKPKSVKSESAETANKDLSAELKQAVKDLFYISETDAPFETLLWKPEASAKAFSVVDAAAVLPLAEKPPDTAIREIALEDFFSNLTAEQDWYGDEEKEIASRYKSLQQLISQNLRDAKVFKIGEIEIDVYILGIDKGGNIAGLKTKAVET